MAKPSSTRWPRAMASSLLPRGDVLLLLLAFSVIISLLTHELSRRSALAAHFEGFDSDELASAYDAAEEDEDDDAALAFTPLSPPISQSESHHGPPPPPSPPPPSVASDDPGSAASKPSLLDLWDEDEFEGIPVPSLDQIPSEPSEPHPSSDPEPSIPTIASPASLLRSYSIEIACVSFLICFVINYFTGKRENEAIALAWASKFATKDSIFDKNFSLLGTGDGKDTPLLLKEGQDVFKFYASGRRHCQGMLATMELRSRHDLISRMLDVVLARKDTITFEVVMNEDAMDHVVLAMARRKAAKAMQKDARDLQRFAGLLLAPPAGRKWVADELLVVAESKEVAGDLITDAVLDQVFGDKAFEKFGKWFISLHFSDQQLGSHKKILMFKFVLPDTKNMADMTRLVALVPYYIDLIGRYKLSSHARAKTEAARAKATQEAYKDLQNARQETLQKKKAEKRKLMEEAETKMSAEALRKKEEKERARMMKKVGPRVKMLRS
ncbi:Uncharacterized protein ACMD2_24828 [Ananas comosus]|uniref:Coiled-coil domain-containing protein 47 n=1 Tax=Ananas comosus TaxID=4615 RepID=A0A199V041_ANACO|nr:Uncharacterized protein ACMD2_24828 [Ananas comosus]